MSHRSMLQRWAREEEGIALLTVLLFAIVLGGMVVVFVARSINESDQSRISRDYEGALHTAEAAADELLGDLNLEDEDNPIITTNSTTGDMHVYNPSSPPADEEVWAIGLAAADTGALIDTDVGQAYAIRPMVEGSSPAEPVQTIWAVGFVPSFDSPNRQTRVIKLQIERQPFEPKGALQTDGDLDMSGGAEILDPDCDPASPDQETCNADVLVNGNWTFGGVGSYEVQGDMRIAGGNCPASPNTTGGECYDQTQGVDASPVQPFQARDFYNRNCTDSDGDGDAENLNPDSELQRVACYDLCPDGTISSPAASGPCTGAEVWPAGSSSTNYRGWKWQAGQWRSTDVEAGMYYVYHADAVVNGSDPGTENSVRAVTIIVEQDPANPSNSGSLDVGGNPRMEPAFPDVQFVVDGDLKMGGTPGGSCGTGSVLSGFIGVTEQISISGTVDINGAMVVQDAEQEHGLVTRTNDGIGGTMCLDYNPKLSIDITGIYAITFWNEL